MSTEVLLGAANEHPTQVAQTWVYVLLTDKKSRQLCWSGLQAAVLGAPFLLLTVGRWQSGLSSPAGKTDHSLESKALHGHGVESAPWKGTEHSDGE